MFGKRRRQSNWTEILDVVQDLHAEARTTFVGDPALGMNLPGTFRSWVSTCRRPPCRSPCCSWSRATC
jgi:hypothetical protein